MLKKEESTWAETPTVEVHQPQSTTAPTTTNIQKDLKIANRYQPKDQGTEKMMEKMEMLLRVMTKQRRKVEGETNLKSGRRKKIL
jgi:hypothetical protein